MLKTSDNVFCALIISTILLFANQSQAQDLSFRVDHAAYLTAQIDPSSDVYLRITYEPNTSGLNSSSNVK